MKNEHFRNGEFEVIGIYECSKCKILVKGKYGECFMSPQSLLQNNKPSIRSAVDKTSYWINMACEVHGGKYDYSKVDYVDKRTKVGIICSKHGEFEQSPNDHLNNGGCKQCGIDSRVDKMSHSTEDFINKSIKTHGDKYDYSKVNYRQSHKDVEIVCSKHGSFYQRPCNHINGAECPKCSSRGSSNSCKLQDWKKMCPGNSGIFYILRCWNENEEFYKVGITCRYSIDRRYTCNTIPYNYEVLTEIKDYDREKIWNLEKRYLTLLKEYHYTPKIKFGGSVTECFKIIKN